MNAINSRATINQSVHAILDETKELINKFKKTNILSSNTELAWIILDLSYFENGIREDENIVFSKSEQEKLIFINEMLLDLLTHEPVNEKVDIGDLKVAVQDLLSLKISNKSFSQINKQVVSLENTIEKQKDRLDKVIDQFYAESNRVMDDLNKKSNSYDYQLKQESETLKNDILFIRKNYVDELEVLKGQAQEIVHIISGTGLAGAYQKVANNARTISFVWQAITVILLVVLLKMGYMVSELAFTQESIWVQFIPKVLVISIIGVAVKYSSTQTRYYQEIERINRKIQLELESLEPYVSVLSSKDADTLRTKLADNYFVGQNEKTKAENDSLNFEHWSKGLLDLVRSLTKNFKENQK